MLPLRIVLFDFNNNYGGAPQTTVLTAKWLNEKEEVVDVKLEYRYPESGSEDLSRLMVSIYLQPRVKWNEKKFDSYENIHLQGKTQDINQVP